MFNDKLLNEFITNPVYCYNSFVEILYKVDIASSSIFHILRLLFFPQIQTFLHYLQP